MLAAALVLLVASTVGVVLKVRRDHEWAHGGDRMVVTVQTLLANPQSFRDAIAALGVPALESSGLAQAQAVVAKVTWSGWMPDDGHFQLVALDRRTSPPRVLAGDGGWTSVEVVGNPSGQLDSGWVSSYDNVLAEHYDWLAGLQARYDAVPFVTMSPGVLVPAKPSGTATVWFTVPESFPALTDQSNIIIGMIYFAGPSLTGVTLEEHIRWARRIHG